MSELKDFIATAKKVLNEDAGSEGLVYRVTFKNKPAAIDNKALKLDEGKQTDKGHEVKVTWSYPRDYGFALSSLKKFFPNNPVVKMELVY